MKEFYQNSLKKQDAIEKNGWNSKELANKRYIKCASLVQKVCLATRLFDYGCGTGLLEKFIVSMKYTGVEEIQDMVDEAINRNPNIEVYCSSLENFDVGVYGKMSIAVSNGIYMVGPHDTRQSIFDKTIEHCKLLCDRHYWGYLFNSKHNIVTYKEDHNVYYDLGKLIKSLKSEGLKVNVFLFDEYEFFIHCQHSNNTSII